MAAGKECHQDLVNDYFLTHDTPRDLGLEPRCSLEQLFAG